jgi:hypothetical protein
VSTSETCFSPPNNSAICQANGQPKIDCIAGLGSQLGSYAELTTSATTAAATTAITASAKHKVYCKTHGYTQSENQEDELLSCAFIESLSN